MTNIGIKLNLGCGYRKLDGYVNVDVDPQCQPDVIVDLENQNWPFADNSVSEIILFHVLEHLGETKAQYFHVIKELYRVSAPGARILIRVPHHRHDNQVHDCTHVRAITPQGLAMFSKAKNRQTIQSGGAESCLGLMIDVDFELASIQYALLEPYHSGVTSGRISEAQMQEILATQNNICEEVAIEMRAVKAG